MSGTSGDSGPAINVVLWLLFAVAFIAVVLRVNARTRRNHQLGWDDYLMIFSLLLNLLACICGSVAISHGLGKHMEALSPEQKSSTTLWSVIAIDIGIMADTVPKLAVALLINTILNPKPLVRGLTITSSAILICFGVVLVIMSFEQCQPIAHQWDKETVRGSCWSPKVFTNFGIAVGAYSSLIDLCFSIYPPLIVSQLNMQLQKKVTVMIIFSLGLFAFFTTLYKTAAELPKLKDAQVNFSRVNAQVMLWTTLESSVVITAGSIPTWGWVFRTEKFETFVRWISLRSIRTHTSERLPSYGRETDKDSDRINLKEGRATPDEEQSRSMGLQSIVQIEREALS